MKRHSKKILAMFLSAMMLAAAASSCGQEKEPSPAPASSSSAASQTGETDSGLTPVGELPISKDGLTLTAFAQNNGSNNDWSYGNNDFTTWLVDQTGIQLDITLAASADAKEKLSLLITAGEYPEVLFRSGLSLSEQQIYGAQGMLLPLNAAASNSVAFVSAVISLFSPPITPAMPTPFSGSAISSMSCVTARSLPSSVVTISFSYALRTTMLPSFTQARSNACIGWPYSTST